MKKISFFTLLTICAYLSSHAQVSFESNSSFTPTHFVGWDNTGGFPLNIRHDASAQPVDFWTNNLRRMRINSTASETIFGNTHSTSGFVGISSDPTFWSLTGPRSLLHVASDDGVSDWGWREWMRYGISITGNGDLMCQESKLLKFIDLRCSRPPMPSGI